MFEDFETTTKVDQKTSSSSVKRETTEVAVDTKDNARSEIIQDVDNIISNLAELSDRIAEDLNLAFSEILSEDIDLIAEAGAGDELMKMFKSMAAYTKLSTTYPKLADKKASIETEKTVYGFTFPMKREELVAAAMDKQKEAINKKIEAIDDPAKRKEARTMRDAKLKEIEASLNTKADQQKDDKNKKFDRDIADVGSAISTLTSENKPESSIISAKWEATKLSIDRKIEDKYTATERAAIAEYVEDPERQKRLEKAIKDRVAKDNAEAKEQLEAAKARAEKEQAALDAKIANAAPDQKEALGKIKAFNTAYSDLAGKLGLDSESTKEEVDAAKEASSNLDKAHSALSKGVMKKAFGYEDDTDAETALSDFTEREAELQKEYDANKALVKRQADDNDLTVDDGAKSASEVADEYIANNADFKTVDNPEEEVTYTENGEEKTMKKWTDLKDIKGKDAAGNDVDDDVVKVGKLAQVPENSSLHVPADGPITESFAFKTASVADRFRNLM